MNPTKLLGSTFLLACLLVPMANHADPVTNTFSSVNLTIPDNSYSGVSDSHFLTFDPGISSLTDVKVELNIAGGFNGDIYAYLTHGTGFAVLLNRTGRTTGNTSGYADAGFNQITLSSSDSANNIHLYQNFTVPPGGGPLTGLWAPDGRNVSPLSVLDTDPSTATLTSFIGGNPNGQWTLFLADVSPGATATLEDWSLIITAVPEPSTFALGLFGGLSLLLFHSRHRRAN